MNVKETKDLRVCFKCGAVYHFAVAEELAESKASKYESACIVCPSCNIEQGIIS